jgi:excisionase family DNA binding protein
MEPNSISPLLDLKAAALYLCAKVATVRWLIRTGQVEFVRVGRKFCVFRAELDRWIAAHSERKQPKAVGSSLVQHQRNDMILKGLGKEQDLSKNMFHARKSLKTGQIGAVKEEGR